MDKILLTGAAGRIGTAVYEALSGKYDVTLCDLRRPEYALRKTDRFVAADLSDQTIVAPLVKGHDCVVHLAGIPDPNAAFDDLLPANILATTHLIEAAATAGCRRFVFASSAQAIEGYPVDVQVADGAAPRPANMYGVTKAYGEALCAFHATRNGLSCVALRIGAFEDPGSANVATPRDLSAWISVRDGTALILAAITAELTGFFVAHGISDNRFKRMDLSGTKRVLGYAPQDDAFQVFDVANILKRPPK